MLLRCIGPVKADVADILPLVGLLCFDVIGKSHINDY